MTAQTVARDREECATRTVAKQGNTDDHVREMMPLNDGEEASQQHLEGEGPSRHQCDSQEWQHRISAIDRCWPEARSVLEAAAELSPARFQRPAPPARGIEPRMARQPGSPCGPQASIGGSAAAVFGSPRR